MFLVPELSSRVETLVGKLGNDEINGQTLYKYLNCVETHRQGLS